MYVPYLQSHPENSADPNLASSLSFFSFELHYLGSTELSFTLNFSRPAHPIIGNYSSLQGVVFSQHSKLTMLSSLIRWYLQASTSTSSTSDSTDTRGSSSPTSRTRGRCRELSRFVLSPFSSRIRVAPSDPFSLRFQYSEYYTVLSDIHRKASTSGSLLASAKETLEDEDDVTLYARGLPVVSFRFTDQFKDSYPDIKQEWIQHLLRQSGWIVPNYALSPNLGKIEILRVVVRPLFISFVFLSNTSDISSIRLCFLLDSRVYDWRHAGETRRGDHSCVSLGLDASSPSLK